MNEPLTGGPKVCPKPCSECPDGKHHFSDSMVVFATDEPEHEAAQKGVGAWHVCKHCETWLEYMVEDDGTLDDPYYDDVEEDYQEPDEEEGDDDQIPY